MNEKQPLLIYNGNSKNAGVYKITNKLNNRIYIGSAKRFQERWKSHISSLNKNKHLNRFLQADWNKSGAENFVFEILEITEGEKQERLLIEEKYIKQHFDGGKQCYNLINRAVSRENNKTKDPEKTKEKYKQTCLERYGVEHVSQTEEARKRSSVLHKGRKQTPEHIEKSARYRRGKTLSLEHKEKLLKYLHSEERFDMMSKVSKELWKNPEYREAVISKKRGKNLTPEHKEKLRLAKLGKKQTPEHIEAARITRIGKKLPPMKQEQKDYFSKIKKGKPVHTEEFKRKMSERRRNIPLPGKELKPVLQFSKDGKFIKEYQSIMDACRENKVFSSNLTKCCQGKLKSTGGYVWKYKE